MEKKGKKNHLVKKAAKSIKKAAKKSVPSKASKLVKKLVAKKASPKKASAKKVSKPVKKIVLKKIAKPLKKTLAKKPVAKKNIKQVKKLIIKKAAKPAKKVQAKKIIKKAVKKVVAKKILKPVKVAKKAKVVAKKVEKTTIKKAEKLIAQKPLKIKAIKVPALKKEQPPIPLANQAFQKYIKEPKKAVKKSKRDMEDLDNFDDAPKPEIKIDLSSSLIKKLEKHQPIPQINKDTRSRYNDSELQEFKKLILEKLEEARKDYELLKSTLSHKDDHGTDDTSPTFKLLEDGSDVLSKEETSHLAGRQEKFIINLQNALIRIENKTYGICRATGKLISKERLRSVPHATLSIDAKLERTS